MQLFRSPVVFFQRRLDVVKDCLYFLWEVCKLIACARLTF
jgi:hypothetical protein